ncbi:MAG: hypothetical protein D6723_19230 [Acidobacteria bacterium]|nr:MAG: hypothetical protein D6723_19230 [Acidobacteriota bacterium]
MRLKVDHKNDALLIFASGTAQVQVAVLTFASLSLILASFRGDPGCEVMSIPGAIYKRHTAPGVHCVFAH